jgi:hypothetical protein
MKQFPMLTKLLAKVYSKPSRSEAESSSAQGKIGGYFRDTGIVDSLGIVRSLP